MEGCDCPEVGQAMKRRLVFVVIVFVLLLTLACGASTYSYGAPTGPTIEAQATITEAQNAAGGIVPVGTLIPEGD